MNIALLATSLTLAAVTPAKVTDVKINPAAAPRAKPPSVIYVNSFTLNLAAPKADAEGEGDSGGRPHLFGLFRGGEQNTILGRHKEEQHEATLEKLPGALKKALIEDLDKAVAPAQDGDGAQATRWDCWVIKGQFIDVNQGSAALQAGVGLGAGQSDVEVQAQVYTVRDLDTPFLTFDSKGASGHMPGAVMMHNPYVAAAKFVMSKKQPEKEAKKVAKAIAEALGKFMAAQHIPTLQPTPASAAAPTSPSSSSKGNRTPAPRGDSD